MLRFPLALLVALQPLSAFAQVRPVSIQPSAPGVVTFDLGQVQPDLAAVPAQEGALASPLGSEAPLPRFSLAPLHAAPAVRTARRTEASRADSLHRAARLSLTPFSARRLGALARMIASRAALLLAPTFGASCSVEPAPVASETWTHPDGKISVYVNANPFQLVVKDAAGNILMESADPHQPGDPTDDIDPVRANAPLSLTHVTDISPEPIVEGWDTFAGLNDPWARSNQVTSFDKDAAKDVLTAHVAVDGGKSVTVRLEPQGSGVHLTATVDGDPSDGVNRVSLGFKMHSDDHFLGLGERYVQTDHRGQSLNNWVEDDGIGLGEGTVTGPILNPFPNGEGQSHIPIPWFLSPRGFGMLLNGTYRTVHHLGDEAGDAWRVESWQRAIDTTLFADPDPTKLVEDLTGITGRPPAPADWLLAPRRRADHWDEADKLRAAHIPTSVLDLDNHYFPNGGGDDHAAMQALTAEAHRRGFKAVSYFCPFVADSWHPVFDEAVAKGYLVKHADGSPYVVLDYPYNAGMVDFTNPDAVAWYKGFLNQAIDDGWDGWMYDFAEYVPRDAVMFNGMSGDEAHNLYPVLYQKAARDVMNQRRPNDFLFFVRSGFIGTGGTVPMVWAGDQNTDFDKADGLPAALTGALNAGLTGLPFWGSDIGGYHSIFNPPTDKELYIRWTELGAFSVDMHDENNGQGLPYLYSVSQRWSLWSDQETQDVYKKMATAKTRMIPYVKLAVRDALAHGTPVMRHLYLGYPKDPNVVGISDEYMFGDSLLVAPVVTQGATSRSVYLPEKSYFDFWSGARIAGGGWITAPASLDAVPVYAKPGAIIPMYSSDVETLIPSADGSVTSLADRSDFLEAAVFAGGTTSVTLDDGTQLSQTSPLQQFTPADPVSTTWGGLNTVLEQSGLSTCGTCAYNDAANRVYQIAMQTAGDTVTAGPLTVSVANSPSVKRYLFTVHY
jgi:alpha-glucosidase (family GH31 glycosyl hydrolase)